MCIWEIRRRRFASGNSRLDDVVHRDSERRSQPIRRESVPSDYAITTQPLLLNAIETPRSPAAERYGGNAMNDVINLIDRKVVKMASEGRLPGAIEVRFGIGDDQ